MDALEQHREQHLRADRCRIGANVVPRLAEQCERAALGIDGGSDAGVARKSGSLAVFLETCEVESRTFLVPQPKARISERNKFRLTPCARLKYRGGLTRERPLPEWRQASPFAPGDRTFRAFAEADRTMNCVGDRNRLRPFKSRRGLQHDCALSRPRSEERRVGKEGR